MADKRFFTSHGPFTLAEIAKLSGAQLGDGADPDYKLNDMAPLSTAGANELSFLDNRKYRDQFTKTKAGACFVAPELAGLAPKGLNLLISQHPYKSYALAAQAFYPDNKPEAHISPAAHIDDTASLGQNCTVEVGAVIGAGVKIGKECWIEAGAVIRDNVEIGNHCRIGANATISHALIADYVRLYPGVRVGQDGFGFAIDPAGHVKVPQLGRVIIEDHVEVGANTAIDRGTGPDTIIGQGTCIDNLVQIGHNVKIGKGCVIVAQVGISGSSVIEDYAAFGGQAGVAGHLTVGKGAQVAAQSGVIRDVPPGETQMGTPALPMKQFMRHIATLNRLIKKEQ